MLIRKINNINGQRLRIGALAVDPHGKLVCIYEHERSQFILIEIPNIYKHFEQYRIDYIVNKCYDNKHQLTHSLIFKSEQILESFPTVQFSQVFEEAQFVIIYYCTFVEVVRVNINRGQISFRVLYKLSSQILELTILNDNIYISMYDGSIFNIFLHRIQGKKKGDICKKIAFINESMKRQHIGISESLRLEQNKHQNYKIWQSFSGKLMINRRIITNQFQDNFDYQNSFQQYLGKQLSEKHPMKYEMSRCRQYIIGSSSGKLFSSNSIYTIRGRWCDWAQLCELSVKPQINQFWTSYQYWMREHQNWGFPLLKKPSNGTSGSEKPLKSYQFDKILFAYYCSAQCSLIISWIIIDKAMRKKVNSHPITKKGNQQVIQLVRYKGIQKVILRAAYLKNPISDIRWIGLNQLLVIDKEFSLYFIEFDPYVLRD